MPSTRSGHPRKGLCLAFEGIIERALVRRREQEQGISTLFSLFDEQAERRSGRGIHRRASTAPGWPIPDLEFDKAERLAFEKEMLGLYVSDHPLMGLEKALRSVTDVTMRDLLDSATAGRGRAGAVGAGTAREARPRTSRSHRRRGHRSHPPVHAAG